MGGAPLLAVEGLGVAYGRGAARFSAIDGVSLDIRPGETLGVIGESGSGKSTLARAVLRRVDAAAGTIRFEDEDITRVAGRRLRRLRQHIQMVFQDPTASLNGRMRVFDILAEPLIVHGRAGSRAALQGQVEAMLAAVGLPADAAWRTPHAFSGGQRQRIGIARALMLGPKLVVADEPVSALDVSVRAQVVNLMRDLQAERGVAYLFIAHDLSIVRHVSHRIAILYCGRVIEVGSRDAVSRPLHPYTRALLDAELHPDPATERTRPIGRLGGEVPSPLRPPPGCRFQTRCPRVATPCRSEEPLLVAHAHDHSVACHFPLTPLVN